MKRVRKDLFREMAELRNRVKAVLRRSIDETRRTNAILRDTERRIEDRFAQLGSFDTERERAARKFRKLNGLNLPRPASQLQISSIPAPDKLEDPSSKVVPRSL